MQPHHDVDLAQHLAADLKQRADAAFRAGECEAALELYAAAATASPDLNPVDAGAIHANSCAALLKLGDADAALRAAEQALRLRPRWGKAHLRAAQAHEAVGDGAAAARAYARAAELDAGLAEAAGRRLAALERRGSQRLCRATLQGRAGAVYAVSVCPQVRCARLREACLSASAPQAREWDTKPADPSLPPAQELLLGCVATRPIAAACASGAVQLWCSATGLLLQALGGHADAATAVAWSPDGRLLASGSLDHTARLWHLAHRCEQQQQLPHGTHSGAGDAPAGGEPAASAARLVDVHAVLAGHTGRVTSLAFAPVGALLATASTDGTVRLWSTADGGCVRELAGHGSSVTAACFSPCSSLLASASGEGPCRGRQHPRSFCSSPGDTHCRIWAVRSGECLHDIAWESGGVNLCRFVAIDATEGAAGAAADAAAGEPHTAAPAPGKEGPAPPAPPCAAAGMQLAAPPPYHLVTCHIQPQRREGRILLWDLGRRAHGWVDGRLCAPCATIDGLRGQVTSLDARAAPAAGGGALLAAACADGVLRVYELAPGPQSPQRPARGAAAAGSAVAAAPPPAPQPAPLFEVPMDRPAAGGGAPQASAVPAWSAAAVHASLHARGQVSLCPRGALLAASGPDHCIRVLEVESGQEVALLRGHSSAVRALCWLGARELLSAGEDGTARIWRLVHPPPRSRP
eukprot:scaffold12.g8061.t1